MTPYEAIERLQIMVNQRELQGYMHEVPALKLGKEALKFYAELKRTQGIKIAFLLPGETEE